MGGFKNNTLSIFYKLNYLKKKELYSIDDKVGIQIVYYFDKKRISFSTINVKIKDWDDQWRNKRTNELVFSSRQGF
ncbi:MAG: hypothetical protein ACK5H1_04500 [Tenacibaculum sp.]